MKRFLFFIFLIYQINCYSQVLKYTSGNRIDDYTEGMFNLYHLDDSTLYVFRNINGGFYIDFYDRVSLNRTTKIKVPLPSRDTTKYELEALFIRPDTFQILYSYFDKGHSQKKLEVTTFNKSGQSNGTKKIDDSVGGNNKTTGGFSVFNNRKRNEFISCNYKNGSDTDYVNMDHFDYAGNKIKSQNILMPERSEFVITNVITSDCSIYHLCRSKRKNRNNAWSSIEYSPELEQAIATPLTLASSDKVIISNSIWSFEKDDKIWFFSPYANDRRKINSNGLYVLCMNTKNHQLVSETVVPFRKPDGSIDEEGIELSYFFIKSIITLQNNSWRILFESRLATTSSVYGIKVATEYDIGNIITVDIDSSLRVTSIHNIKKDQHTNTSNYNYTSFVPLTKDDKTYLIYNELPRNINALPEDYKKLNSARMDDAVVAFTVFDDKVKRNILINKEDKKVQDIILPGMNIYDSDKSQLYVIRN